MNISDTFRIKGMFNGRPTLGPREVNIHINNICQHQCVFCWYFSPLVTKETRPKQLDFTVLSKLICDCAKMGVRTINLEGGEVTLYPRFPEIFQLIKAKGMELDVYSHLAFPKGRLNSLRFADSINVNLCATNKHSYTVMHGDDNFDQVITNLKLLAILKKGGKPSITLSFIITDRNYKEIVDLINLAIGLKVDQVRFMLFSATQEMKGLLLSKSSAKKLKNIIRSVLKGSPGISHNLKDIIPVISARNFLKERTSLAWDRNHNDRHFYYQALPRKKTKCYVGWFYAFIDEIGRVIAPCDNVGVCVAGNIHQERFPKIWFDSPELKKIRAESLDIDTTKEKWYECRCCGYKNFNTDIAAQIKEATASPRP